MERNLKEALKHRRSYYAIDNQTTIPDAEIEEILDFAALYTPSAFNSQVAGNFQVAITSLSIREL